MPVAPVATAAPKPALGVSPDGGSSGASAGAAGGAAPSVYLRRRRHRWHDKLPMDGRELTARPATLRSPLPALLRSAQLWIRHGRHRQGRTGRGCMSTIPKGGTVAVTRTSTGGRANRSIWSGWSSAVERATSLRSRQPTPDRRGGTGRQRRQSHRNRRHHHRRGVLTRERGLRALDGWRGCGMVSAFGSRTNAMSAMIDTTRRLRPLPANASAPACSGLLRPAPACSGLLRPAPACSGLLRPAPACSGLLRPAPACSGLLRPAPACSGLRKPSTR